MGWNDIDDPKDNQESSELRTWDQYLFKLCMFFFIFVLAFIFSLYIFTAMNIAGHSSGHIDGIGFFIVYAFMYILNLYWFVLIMKGVAKLLGIMESRPNSYYKTPDTIMD